MSPSPLDSAAARQKELGAFYTPRPIARELVTWAIRAPSDTVLDPSFGSLAFLEAAEARLETLGGAGEVHPGGRLYGIEVDDQAFAAAAARLWSRGASPTLVHRDFLSVRPGELVPAVDVVVGNPPYLRYQGFNAHNGCVPGLVAAAASVPLTRLASSWAPFVVHAVRFVAAGGRLAHVLPGQLLHAQYAQPVTEFLRREFRRVAVIAFEERVFPSAQEEVVLLCAEERGSGPARIEFFSVSSLDDLNVELLLRRSPKRPRCAGKQRGKLLAELLPPRTRRIYDEAEEAAEVTRLGNIAQVDIGTVTGANSFFLLSSEAAAEFDSTLFTPAIGRAAHIPGVRFTTREYRSLQREGARCQLLLITAQTPPDVLESVRGYIRHGEALELHTRNKCRSRSPWWELKLPRQPIPNLFMTYCAHRHPRLVINDARAMHTNTVHGVVTRRPQQARALAVGFYNSLTMLSAELLARSYGGGVLKLEPTEAEALLIPPLEGLASRRDLLSTIDGHIRARDLEAALDLIDAIVLSRGLGLRDDDIRALRHGADRLRSRRYARRFRPRAA